MHRANVQRANLKFKLMALAMMGLSCLGLSWNALAAAKSHKQLMKECMAELERTSTGVAIQDLHRACEEQIKAHKDHPNDPRPATAPLPSVVPPT